MFLSKKNGDARAAGFAALLTGLVLCTLIALPALPAQAVEYGGFGGRPAYPREDNPRTESIFVHTLEPGDVQDEGVLLVNNSAGTKTLLVYATDSARSSDGAFACAQQGDERQDVGVWIALEQNEATLSPGSQKIVPFTISVPESADAGEHNGCIIIQERKVKDENATGMSLSFRTGLRVALTIPGELIRSLEVVDLQVSRQPRGVILFHPAVRNNGNVSIDADVRVAMRGPLGDVIAEKGGTYPILRGDTSEWNFEATKPFWGGWYRAETLVTYDANTEAGVGVESGKEKTVLRGHAHWFFSTPTWPAVGIELVVLVMLFFGIRTGLRRRALDRWVEKSWVASHAEAGDTVTAIAERHGIPWKILARVNRLKPPYALSAGQELRVPPRPRASASSMQPPSSAS